MNISLAQTAVLGKRAVIRTARQPANVVFPLIFPMLLLAVNAGGLRAETRLPGFPTASFLAFALAGGAPFDLHLSALEPLGADDHLPGQPDQVHGRKFRPCALVQIIVKH